MNILIKISAVLLLAVGFHPPLLAQKKLALANECFQAKAYYLASRYYQEVFDKKKDECHPDKIKMAQSLAASQQLEAAEIVFNRYMDCLHLKPADNIIYGKFLMDRKAYERAIPYFEKALEAEPDLARHYILACQTALPKPTESEIIAPVFVNQTTETTLSKTEAIKDDPSLNFFPNQKDKEKIKDPLINIHEKEINQITIATDEINLYKAMTSANRPRLETTQAINTTSKAKGTNNVPENLIINEVPNRIEVKKKISPYGVRLGTYKNAIIPDLSVVEQYGRIDKKKWKGKTIVFLVDFSSRAAAEAALALAQRENFRSAILVEKLASGRMKSIR